MRPPMTPLVLLTASLGGASCRGTAQQEDDQAFLRVPVPEEGRTGSTGSGRRSVTRR